MSRLRFPRAAVLGGALSTFACCLALGCGGDGTHRVSGKVTFKGQPVPAGRVTFIPDSAKGNQGPTGYADITDGAYDTGAKGGKGAVTGPVNIVVEGYDPNAPPEPGTPPEEGAKKPLFPKYTFPFDVPAGGGTKDIDVPGAAPKGPASKGQPAQVDP